MISTWTPHRWLGWALGICAFWCTHETQARPRYPWLQRTQATTISPLYRRIAPPSGYRRVRVRKGSFAWWLRGLPLKPPGSPVLLYNGGHKGAQEHHVAVVKIDVGTRDLQQCADAVMRLWGEYLWSRRLERHYHFRMLNGMSNPWWRWAQGDRRRFSRGRLGKWRESVRQADATYRNFRKYLWYVMGWTNTTAMVRQLRRIPVSQARAGDLWLVGWQNGSPGHAVLLLDEVRNAQGQKLFLLGQSYMPAQSFHILKAPGQPTSPWYAFPSQGQINTPEWTFQASQLYRLPHRRETR